MNLLYALLPVLGYFVVAGLAVTPHTHTLRLALWSVITLLALRAAASVDMSVTGPDQGYNYSILIVSPAFHTKTGHSLFRPSPQ